MDHPIIFSGPMVQALLAGRKTQTRRLCWIGRKAADGQGFRESPWARVKPGDRLWVRERFHVRPIASAMHALSYFDEEDASIIGGWKKVRLLPHYHSIKRPSDGIWKPSIHMPRSLSRLTLIVTAKKIEPLQDISHDDAVAEGVGIFPNSMSARKRFRELWESLHGAGSWTLNPEVVAISFTMHRANVDSLKEAA